MSQLLHGMSPYSTLFARLVWSQCLVWVELWWVWQKVALPCIVVVARGILSCTSCVLCPVRRSLLPTTFPTQLQMAKFVLVCDTLLQASFHSAAIYCVVTLLLPI